MRNAIVILVLAIAHVAHAGPPQILVMRAEGTADVASRTSIDSHVLRLARHIDGKVEAGEITITEAAAAVGCMIAEPSCKDELLSMLGVDELVTTTVTATSTGFNVTVRRITKSGTQVAQTTIPSGTVPDAKLDADIGPLFGLPGTPGRLTPTAPPPTKHQPTLAAKTEGATRPPPLAEPASSALQPAPTVAPEATAAPPATTATTPPPAPAAAPEPPPEPLGPMTLPPVDHTPDRRWQKVGMGAGAALVLLGFWTWGQATDIQNEIDGLEEPRTRADIEKLRDLERRGDDAAARGNLMFLAGAVVGGVSAYYYWRAGQAASTRTARITPTAFPGGAGVTLTVGGLP